MTDIVDEIAALVDAQLANYGQRSGYDFNVGQDKCPHAWCREDFHGLAITRRMREMRAKWHSAINYYEDQARASEQVAAELDAYRYDEDDSEVLCPGSSFVGEFTPPEDARIRLRDGDWGASAGLVEYLAEAQRLMSESIGRAMDQGGALGRGARTGARPFPASLVHGHGDR